MANSLLDLRLKAQSIAAIPSHLTSPLQHFGGKSRVSKGLWELKPGGSDIHTFIDPFGGGCSVPLAFKRFGNHPPKHFLIRDIFLPVINFWQVLQASPWKLAYEVDALLNSFQEGKDIHSKCINCLLDWLETGQGGLVAAAAYFIHSHLCYPSGLFDLSPTCYAPSLSGWIHSAQNQLGRLVKWSELIQGWDIQQQDYQTTLAEAVSIGKGVFIFADPPYEASSKRSNPKALYGHPFTDSEQDHLASLVKQADQNGCKVMVTINHSPANLTRYQGFHQLVRTQAYGTIETDGKCRVGTELVFLTYEPPFMAIMAANNNWKLADAG